MEPKETRAPEERPETPRGEQQVDRHLLELLVCPVTKTRLEYDSARQELVSRAAGLAYPIREGVPLMTEEAARHLESDEPPV